MIFHNKRKSLRWSNADLPIREVPAKCIGYFEQPSSRQSRDVR